ncbi:hypothetical protein MHYP_G00121360 [Metynnis hypsauchen]
MYSFKEHPLKNICTNGLKSIQVQVTGVLPTHYKEIALVSLAVFLLVGLIFLCMYRCRARIFYNLCRNQGQSGEADEDNMDNIDAIYANGRQYQHGRVRTH